MSPRSARDPLSERMLGFFAAEGLDTGLVERRDDRVPGLYAISVDAAGERSFTYWRDAAAARTLFLPPCAVTPERLADFDLVYLSAITLAVLAPEARQALAEFLAGYRARGGRVAFDSNYRPRLWPDVATARAEVARFWALTDVGLPSLDDELALYGEAGEAAVLARLAAAGVARGALKRGAEGPRSARGGRAAAGISAGGARGRHDGGRRQLQRRLPRRRWCAGCRRPTASPPGTRRRAWSSAIQGRSCRASRRCRHQASTAAIALASWSSLSAGRPAMLMRLSPTM